MSFAKIAKINHVVSKPKLPDLPVVPFLKGLQFNWQFTTRDGHINLMNILFLNRLPFTRTRVHRKPVRPNEHDPLCEWYQYTICGILNVFLMKEQEEDIEYLGKNTIHTKTIYVF
jgi:hypothetical protein